MVQPGGGFVTPMFDETVFPDHIAARAGPFRAKAPHAADSTTTRSGGSGAAHDGDDDVSLHLVYHDFNNQLTDASGVYVTAWTYSLDDSDGFPVRTETQSTPSNGTVSFTCPDADHYVSGNATLPANDLRDGAGFLVYWEATHDDCGETIQETGTGITYLPWKHLAEVIPEINGHFGYSLNHRVHWIARTNVGTHYDASRDRIRFDNNYNHIWIAAHEYAHALHHNKLGGLWSATNCTGARRGQVGFWGATSYNCALQEGIANYGGNIGTDDWRHGELEDNPDHDPHPASEGSAAALFHDLIDGVNEGDDATTLNARSVMTVFKTCQDSNREREHISDFVWCMEARVNEDVHDENFPDVDAPGHPNSVRPSGWDADDIRSTWLHNLAG